MVESNLSKCTGQRKKRQERETCINNLKLSVNLGTSKERLGIHRGSRPAVDQHTYTKKPREKFLRGSLENVSSNPFGEINVAAEESTLRRSRSLAISREDVFTNLDIPAAARQRNRRSQLIPRAKLIERARYVRGTTPEYERSLTRNLSLTKDYATLPQILHHPQKKHLQASLSLTLTTKHNREEGGKSSPCIQINNEGSINDTEINSISSNYQSRNSIYNEYPYENLTCLDTGLSLPNYYPDSRYDTDNTDNVSGTDNFSITEIESSDNKKDSDPESSPIWNRSYNPHDSISYDENILLSTNSPLYDVLKEQSHYAKPRTHRTLRGSTPFYKDTHNYYTFSGKPHSLPAQDTVYDSDLSLSEEEVKYYEIEENTEQKIEINVKEEQNVSIGYYETDTNIDPVNVNKETAKVAKAESNKEETKSQSNYSNIEANPIYDEVAVNEICPLSESNRVSSEKILERDVKALNKQNSTREIKTCVQVEASVDNYSSYKSNDTDNSEEYRTIVSVENDEPTLKSKQSEKQHCHNYLREFLESQKGSKKPLQNFISKKISRAFGDKQNLSRRNSKGSTSDSNLSDNQFYSLPDINVSKNLRKCEKIDRKLRQCEKESKLAKPTEIAGNRFIVNIGRHFDVTADTNIPVDFELKISKVPKKNRNNEKKRSTIRITNKPERNTKTFIEAVEDLKYTLNGEALDENQNITKPEIIGVTTKTKVNFPKTEILIHSSSFGLKKDPLKRSYTRIPITKKPINKSDSEEQRIMDLQMENAKECTREYQQKLDTMRSYWRKMAKTTQKGGGDEVDKDDPTKCKVVDVTTKVEGVIKKFEPKDEKEDEKQPNIVQITKQIFEQKPAEKKNEKLSPFVKETCGFFENPFYERESDNNQYESLSPNVIEIIESNNNDVESQTKNKNTINAKPKNEARNNVIVTKKTNKTETNEATNKFQNGVSCNTLSLIKKSDEHEKLLKHKNVAEPEFDHVRYRVMKSDLFQKKIFANCEKESQFDGLMQYLQDYSFQELLIDNNIVIIEPIRTKIHHETSSVAKSPHNVTPLLHKSTDMVSVNQSTGLRRHFFYHPIRVNKEVNEDELPNPDTVKQARQFFECGLQRSQSSQNLEEVSKKYHRSVDPDKDRCSAADTNSNPSTSSDRGSNENLYDSIKSELCCEQQYVSEDILEKIRECGTSVTYYGGRVLNKHNGRPSLTKAIMEEIKGNEKRNNDCLCGKLNESKHTINDKPITCTNNKIKRTVNDVMSKSNELSNNNKDVYQGVKFRLLKSNSCSSRLELVGTNNLQEYRNKFLSKQKQLIEEHNLKNQNSNASIDEVNGENEIQTDTPHNTTKKSPEDKNFINENIKAQKSDTVNMNQPKIIGEERKMDKKMTQWGDVKDEKTYASIKFSNNNKSSQKIQYDYHNYEKLKTRPKKIDDMEFEPYEIAGN